MTDQHAELEWRDGVPVSRRFDDPYYSFADGLAETRYVFIDGNRLAERLRPGFHVAELGIGTGLNLLALVALARDLGVRGLEYTGFEAFPLDPKDLRAALSAFPEVAADAERLIAGWGRDVLLETEEITARAIYGDARKTLNGWTGAADAWFLDGFAPARNPELWEPELLAAVAARTAPGGTAATYTAAGHVRRALADAGFSVTRTPGFGSKRHMTRAELA